MYITLNAFAEQDKYRRTEIDKNTDDTVSLRLNAEEIVWYIKTMEGHTNVGIRTKDTYWSVTDTPEEIDKLLITQDPFSELGDGMSKGHIKLMADREK